jgi:hypothetical protein
MTRERVAFTSSLLAILAAVVLVVLTLPLLAAEDDRDALPALFIPLVLATIAFAGLSAKCTSGSVLGERAAVSALTILVFFTIIAGFSIGILALPIAALVALAVATTPSAG